MLLIAFFLGASTAWLFETGWNWYLVNHLNPAEGHQWRVRRNRWAYYLLLGVTLAVAVIFVGGVYGLQTGAWSSPFVRALDHLSAPKVLGGIVATALGALLVAVRHRLPAGITLLRRLVQPRRVEGQKKPSSSAAESSGAKSAVISLTSIVGIAAVTLVALATIQIFFPELITRVESFKVAGVEARFASATSKSLQVFTQTIAGPEKRISVAGWANYDWLSKELSGPAQAAVNSRLGYADPFQNDNNRFMNEIAIPLAKLGKCLSEHFDLFHTDLHGQAARAAEGWGRLFLMADTTPEGQKKSKRQAEIVIKDTYVILGRTNDFLTSQAIECDDRQAVIDLIIKTISSKITCDQNCFNESILEEYAKKVSGDPAMSPETLAATGYAVSFVSSFISWTSRVDKGLEFLDNIRPHLHQSNSAIVAQINVYSARVIARFQARRPSNETVEDCKKAISLVDELLRHVESARRDSENRSIQGDRRSEQLKNVVDHYKRVRASIVNDSLYSIIADWLDGRRLLPHEIAMLEGVSEGGAAYELNKWIDSESISELVAGINKTNLETEIAKQRKLAPKLDPMARQAVTWLRTIGDTYDTLAMRDVVLGAIRNDFSKDRCARIRSLLARSKDSYEKANVTEYGPYIAAHFNIYESACSQ
ncbi:hypothetical protein [Rhodoplanes roseus]|uniref:hypothetical protein n=1 Tax=Rhodoplanes roseus TaxID=29409 RepID=UPI0011B500D7|nr:hypothetical protein [Rhodoplanes roseus]